MAKINATDAMFKVLEDWGVKNIYGLPGGSFDSTMNVLYNRRNSINYVQVRHEEVGALAASAEAKTTGKIGVTFGSAGPGAVHLLNGLYDAQYDHVPVLALVGQVSTTQMNTDYFQELNENSMFADVSVYNRTAMTAESLPALVDEAIRQAYRHNGVAVITIPKDLGWQEIEDNFVSTANNFQAPIWPEPDIKRVKEALELIKQAKQPMLYVGQGVRGAGDKVIALSEKLSMPIVTSALAKGIVPDMYKGNMGVASKPGVETAQQADLILFVGSNYPFAEFFFNPNAKFIQVDIDSSKLGKRHHVDVAILADGTKTLQAFLDESEAIAPTPWYNAALKNKENWIKWVDSFAESDDTPLRVEPIFKLINDMADEDAIFQVDVGNVTIEGMRFLRINEKARFTLSAWYATMGYALPAAIAAQSAYPDRQVWAIAGDGGWSMVAQDLLTQVKYHLPIINVVLSNKSFGFIEGEQDDANQPHSGIDIIDADWGKVADAMGAKGYTIHNLAELKQAFAEIKNADGPVVLDVKITDDRPLPVEQLKLDAKTQDPAVVAKFKETYQADGLIPLRELLEQEN